MDVGHLVFTFGQLTALVISCSVNLASQCQEKSVGIACSDLSNLYVFIKSNSTSLVVDVGPNLLLCAKLAYLVVATTLDRSIFEEHKSLVTSALYLDNSLLLFQFHGIVGSSDLTALAKSSLCIQSPRVDVTVAGQGSGMFLTTRDSFDRYL